MIDMQGIFSHADYNSTLDKFKSSDCNWSIFKELHKDVSNNKCPICEVELDTLNHGSSATIDHFRPQAVPSLIESCALFKVRKVRDKFFC